VNPEGLLLSGVDKRQKVEGNHYAQMSLLPWVKSYLLDSIPYTGDNIPDTIGAEKIYESKLLDLKDFLLSFKKISFTVL
jgi:hypothetical protein